MSRRKAREIVLCLVFEKEYYKDCGCEELYNNLFENHGIEEIYGWFDETPEETEKEAVAEKLSKTNAKYIKSTLTGIFENIGQIDNIISNAAIGWEYSRISKISMALLRISVYEILYADDIPDSVAINEAVELSKKYDDSDAYTFINGICATVVKNKNM